MELSENLVNNINIYTIEQKEQNLDLTLYNKGTLGITNRVNVFIPLKLCPNKSIPLITV